MLKFTLDTLQVQRVYLNPGTTNSFGSNFAESEQCDNTKELKIKKVWIGIGDGASVGCGICIS